MTYSKTLALYKKGNQFLTDTIGIENGLLATNHLSAPIETMIDRGYTVLPIDVAVSMIDALNKDRFSRPWTEITQDRHEELLNVLPPEKWFMGTDISMFRMCEYTSGNITLHVAKFNGKYFQAERQATGSYDSYFAEIQEQMNQSSLSV